MEKPKIIPLCPICEAPLVLFVGNRTPGNKEGFTWECVNLQCKCAEVFGYGKNATEALEVVMHKYRKELQ